MFKIDKSGLIHHYSWSLLACCLVNCCPKSMPPIRWRSWTLWKGRLEWILWLPKLPSLKNFKNLRICIYILLLLPGKMDGCFQHGMFSSGKGLDFSCIPRVMNHIVKKNAWILTTKGSKSQILQKCQGLFNDLEFSLGSETENLGFKNRPYGQAPRPPP